MKAQLTECNDVSCMPELDPAPSLVSTTCLGAGFNSQTLID